MATCMKCGSSAEEGELLCAACLAAAKQPQSVISDWETEASQSGNTEQNRPYRPKKTGFQKVLAGILVVLMLLVSAVSVGKIFYNRDFMQLVLGKNQYARNLEQAAANASAEQLVTVLDETLGAAKNTAANYTENSTYKLNLKVEDEFLQGLNMQKEDTAAIQQAANYVNSLYVSSNTRRDDKGIETTYTISDPSYSKINLQTFLYNDGKIYLHIPEVYDKYLAVGNMTESRFNLNDIANLKYDSAKLKASLVKLAAIYTNSLAGAEMKAENDQSITVDETKVQGQKLTASLNAEQTAAMAKALLQTVENDDYLYSFVSDNYHVLSALIGEPAKADSGKLSREDYKKSIEDLFSKLNLEQDGTAFSAVSYLAQDGTLLAHCYESKGKERDVQINTLAAENKLAVDLIYNHEQGFTFTDLKTNANSGKIQLKVKSLEEPQNIGLNIDYSGLKKAKFLGSDTVTGKYVISLYDPDHEIGKYVSQYGLPQSLSQLDKSSVTIETTLYNEKEMSSTVKLDVTGMFSLSVSEKLRGSPSSSPIMLPPLGSQIIDLSSEDSAAEMNEFTYRGLGYLYDTLDYDPGLSNVLAGFGLTQEQLGFLLGYNQE